LEVWGRLEGKKREMGGKSSCVNVSMVGIKMSFVKHQFEASGLRSEMVEWEEEEGGATRIHCWVPRPPQAERGVWSVSAPEKPALLLLHEFVAGGTLNWEKQIRSFHKHFHVYVPDLLFFGASTSSRQDRTEIFQAECMVKMLHALEVYNEVKKSPLLLALTDRQTDREKDGGGRCSKSLGTWFVKLGGTQ
jgi:hypothetical protein